jgi:nucleoside-diphosphate-sugar epimerase
MRALITGGTGFVGRALVRRLTSEGATIGLLGAKDSVRSAGTDVLALGDRPWSEAAMLRAIGAFRPDTIFHLVGGPRPSLSDLYETNLVLGDRLMAAAARAAPGARIVLIGSAAEYGAPLRADGVLDEDAPCRPLTAYGVAKLAQTLNGLVRARAGQPVAIARLFNPVGPGMPGNLAFSAIAHRLASGSPTLATGNIDVARDFLSIDEAARIIADIARSPAAAGEIVNVCSGIAQPLRDGVERMIARTGRLVRLERDAGLDRSVDPPVIVGDVRKLASLGIRPASSDIGAALDCLLDGVVAARPASLSAASGR